MPQVKKKKNPALLLQQLNLEFSWTLSGQLIKLIYTGWSSNVSLTFWRLVGFSCVLSMIFIATWEKKKKQNKYREFITLAQQKLAYLTPA